ncbi:MAG: electron transport complex subunit RsxC [Spirochaetaceae bacterium]|nr:MAG: electron transport complex subunit RsxC [Spirochaetaceae bacterium]
MPGIRKFPIGGTHLPENKDLTTGSPIRALDPPARVVIPLKQHLGVPCKPIVSPGERVSVGQLIGANKEGLSARIHSSIRGTVTAIERHSMVDHSECDCVIIERDQNTDNQTPAPDSRTPIKGPDAPVPDADTVRERVEEAGIVGMGGAAFPTHVKLQVRKDTPIDSVIINGAECEPFITTDDRLMQERAAELFRGLEIIRITVGARTGYVACEINKPEAIKRIVEESARWPHLEAVRLDTRYPHGAEKHLVKAVLDREVPIRQLPMSVGVLVNNVQTAIAVTDAVDHGIAVTSRVLTVSGSVVSHPGNFQVPLGMSLGDLVAAAGGPAEDDYRLVVGGPMTGILTDDFSIPVTKSTSGVVLIRPGEYADRSAEVCIRCGRCVSVCPMYLQPNRITTFVRNDMTEEAEEFGVNDCILCGACSFVCPSRRPLLQWLREGKAKSAVLADDRRRRNPV